MKMKFYLILLAVIVFCISSFGDTASAEGRRSAKAKKKAKREKVSKQFLIYRGWPAKDGQQKPGQVGESEAAARPATPNGVEAPTVAKMAEQEAFGFPDGNLLRWRTSYETQNLGFNVYRQEGRERVLLTPNLVAGSALRFGGEAVLTAGYSYSWWDADGRPDSVYWIEDRDLNGKTTLSGPVKVTKCSAECAFLEDLRPRESSRLLNEISPQANGLLLRHQPQDTPQAPQAALIAGADAWQKQLQLASLPAVKLRVKQTGWYRVTGAQLQTAGLDANADAGFLQIYADGAQQPLFVRTAGGGDSGPLGAAGVVEFYGAGVDERETDARTYWLIAGPERGLRVGAPARAASGESTGPGKDGSPTPAGFPFAAERRERTFYFNVLTNGEDTPNFFGAVITSTAGNQTIPVTRLVAGTGGTLQVAVQGATAFPHRVQVQLNGTALGEVAFSNFEYKAQQFTVPAGGITEGNNTVTVRSLAGSNDFSIVDYLRLSYTHSYETDGGQFAFTGAHTGLAVSGFTTNQVRVMDITDPGQLFEVAARVSGNAGNFTAHLPGRTNGRRLLAFEPGQALSPVSITANLPSTWTSPTRGAQLLIVAPRDFLPAVEPLANLRRGQGLGTEVINVEDLYDEWSGGEKNVNALRRFFRWAKDNWQTPPDYVLVVGDATYDPRNYTGQGNLDFFPTGYVGVGSGNSALETASDETLTDFNNDGVGELAIGRLPARTVPEVELMVGKIVNYQPGQVANGALMVSDRHDGYNFTAMTQDVRQYLPAAMPVTMVGLEGQPPDATRAAIINGVNSGPLLVNYFGHGSVEAWSGAGILRSSDTPGLSNGNRLAVFYAMTCLNGLFQDLNTNSLGEALIKAPNGGAVASWMSSALTFAPGQQAMARTLYQYIYQGGASARQGDAIRAAKASTFDPDVRRTWILFGDPTMPVR
jgi:hypothetical protein